MLERFFPSMRIDIPREVAATIGTLLGLVALVAFIIGPATAYLCQLAPDVRRTVFDYHFLVVLLLLIGFCTIGGFVVEIMYSATRWAWRTAGRQSPSWLRYDIGRMLTLVALALAAMVGLNFVFHVSWLNGGGLLPEGDGVGLVETGFAFLFGAGLFFSLSSFRVLRPKVAARMVPITARDLAWAMLTFEIAVAVAIGSYSSFALLHQHELVLVGLSERWLWVGFGLSAAILASGVILFARFARRAAGP